jgi:hypothetical protein
VVACGGPTRLPDRWEDMCEPLKSHWELTRLTADEDFDQERCELLRMFALVMDE